MPVERFKAEVDADIKDFKRKMAEVDRQMRELATGVSVEINASINEFITKVQQVQARLQQLDATQATVEIEAILNDFMQDILRAKALAQDLDKESIKIKVHLEMDAFYTQLSMIRAEIDALERERVKVNVEISLGSFMMDYAQIQSLLAHLSGQSGSIKIDVDFSEVIAAIHEVKLAILALKDVTIDIHADITEFLRGVVIVNSQSKKLKKNIVIKIWADYTNAMKSYANTVQAFAEAGRQIIGGALLSLIPALSQFLSALVGLIGSLGVMIGVLVGQLLILASALSIAALGFVGLAAVAIPTIKKLFDETAKLNAEQQRAKASWDAFKGTYDDLVKATEKPVLQAFTSAMQGAQKILKSLQPMIESVAISTAKLMGAFDKSINSQPIQKIFDTFNKYGASIFENFVAGIGNLIAGLGSLIAALAPAAEAWSKNFNGMMQSFASWADGLSQSEKFQSFISYVQTYMPVISDIFADLTMGIIAFFSAFSDMGGNFMTRLAEMMESFRAWAETLGENQQFQQFLSFIQESTPAVLTLLGNLWDLIINLGIALAPVGAIVLDLANSFLEWFNNLLQTNQTAAKLVALFPIVLGVISALAPVVISVVSIFGNLVAAIVRVLPHLSSFSAIATKVTDIVTKVWGHISKLGAVFTWLTTPVGIAVAAIALIISALVLAYNKVDWFRDLVNKAWTSIKEVTSKAFKAVYDTISKALEEVVAFGKQILEQFEQFWEQHGESISSIVKTTFEFIYGFIANNLKLVGIVIKTAWNVITKIFSAAWDLIKGIIQIAIDLVLGIVSAGMSLLQGDWEAAWDTIVETAKSIGTTIVETFGSIIDKVWQIGVDIINGLIEGITSMFDSVAKALGKLTDKIPQWVKDALGIHSPSRVMAAIAKWIPAGIAKGIIDNINVVRTASKEMAQATFPDFSREIKASQAQIEGAQKAVSRAISDNNSEIKELNRNAAQEIYKIQDKLAKDLNGITSKATKGKSKTVKAGNAEITKLQRDANKQILEIQRKLAEETKKVNDSVNADKLQSLQEYIDLQKELYGLSAAEEAAYWKYASTAFKDGTDEKIKALNKYKSAHKTAMQDQFNAETNMIDALVKYGKMSLKEQLSAYEGYMKSYEIGSAEQIAYEDLIYDKKLSLYNNIKSLADDYYSKMKDINQKLLDDEKALRDEYEQTYNSRVEAIKNTWGLFDKVNLTEMVTYNEDGSIKEQINLLENMRGQVNALRGWMNDLFVLEAKGIDKDLLAELQSLGAKSGAEIKALTQMTASELEEYQMLWKTKTELANKQATTELAGARKKMEDEIAQLHINAEKELQALSETFISEVNEMVNGAEDEFNVMTATLPEIGAAAIQGLMDGMKSMKGNLQSTVKGIANSVSASFSNLLTSDGGYQSSIAVNALSGALSGNANRLLNAADDIDDEQQPVNVNIHQEWNGENVETWLDQRSATNLKLKTFKKG